MDWFQWRNGYDTWPPLQARLEAVRRQLVNALTSLPTGSVHLISLCAGDGRDVIGALAKYPHKERVSAYLIEIHPELVARGERAAALLQLAPRVRFLCADATLADTYRSIAPADIVLMAGVLGNVRDEDETGLVGSLRGLCRAGGSVIWTRNVSVPGGEAAMERTRQRLGEAGFRELVLVRTEPPGFAVATHTFAGEPQPLLPGTKLFQFTGYDQLDAGRDVR